MPLDTTVQQSALFWGMMRSQLATLVLLVALAWVIGGMQLVPAAAWGAATAFLGYLWAGFQLWMHPGNRKEKRRRMAAIRAEFGKIIIVLAMFWVAFREFPEFREMKAAAALFVGFFFAQISGWVWLVRKTDDGNHISQAKTDDK